jgi:hypothetical protein
MKSVTWKPGENKELDNLFDKLREQQYQNRNHRLWKNYSKDEIEKWSGLIAYTISFDYNDQPELCSTISKRNCWPDNACRILNRTWKVSNKKQIMPEISQAMGKATLSQISWLKENTDYQFYFISRQTNNWMEWVTKNFKRQFDLNFKIAKNKYLTCSNEHDDSCWQSIIYIGDDSVLKIWKKR